jgi:hypothetical protein
MPLQKGHAAGPGALQRRVPSGLRPLRTDPGGRPTLLERGQPRTLRAGVEVSADGSAVTCSEQPDRGALEVTSRTRSR